MFSHKQEDQKKTKKKTQIPKSKPTEKKCHIVIPYAQGICESYKTICCKYGVHIHFKGGQTPKNLLVSPKDKDTITKKNSIIYWLRCNKIDFDEEYIGESSRTFGERYKEHLKAPSPIFWHQSNTGHTTTVENFRIIGREGNNMSEASKKPYILKWTILSWTKTLENTICHIFEFCIPS